LKKGVYVLRALALRLGLDEFILTILPRRKFILRPIHYPPITSEPANAIRAAAHGDINLITLLMAQGKGLQVPTTKTGLMQLLNQMNW
jgi:isopenicillin N synthase-like dioxygenase